MDRLTRQEVLHVAHLARIGMSEEEICKYQISLKQMIDEIDKIKDLKDFDDEMIFSPYEDMLPLTHKMCENESGDLLKNVPNKKGNFVEVPVMIHE